MSTSPESRHIFNASEAECIAYAIAHGAFAAVRALESQATFGIDIYEAEAQAHQIRAPRVPADIDDMLAFLRDREASRHNAYTQADAGVTVTAEPDDQGEQQIGFDAAAWEAALQAANANGVVALGEEDDFRSAGEEGPALRGQRLAYLIKNDLPFALVDPLDGSNQAAGMGQRSGWAACALVKMPDWPYTAVAVLLGDGRGFVAADGHVWLSESTHPDRSPVFYLIEPQLANLGFQRAHYVIPAAKRSTLERAYAIMRADETIEWISPLGGNPGILAAMLGAGAPAAMQPRAYAWDHMAPLVLAHAGFPVIRGTDAQVLSADDLTEMLLADMVAGRRTDALYVGRTIEFAAQLRDAAEVTVN